MRSIYLLILFTFLTNCSKNNVNNQNNKFLLDISVNISINLNLNPLLTRFGGNSIYIPNEGNGGILVAYTGIDYYAWDAADPNHPQTSCSLLVDLKDLKQNYGLSATCHCDDKNEYSLVTGLALNNGELQFPLRNYRVEKNGSNLIITY